MILDGHTPKVVVKRLERDLEVAKGKLDIIQRTIEGDDPAMLANDYGGTGWENSVEVQAIYRITNRLREAERLLSRYHKETPICHQPYMVAHEVENFLKDRLKHEE
jgi:hypothetical protein